MKLEQIRELLNKNTVEGKVNEEAVHKGINEFFDGVWKTKEEKIASSLKETLQPVVRDEFIKSLGVKDVENADQFNAHVKRLGANATELSEQNAALSKQLEEAQKFETELEKANGKIRNYEVGNLIIEKGFKPKYKNAAKAQAETLVTEELDFKTALDQVFTDYPEWTTAKQKAGGKTPPGQPPSEEEETKRMRDLAGIKS